MPKRASEKHDRPLAKEGSKAKKPRKYPKFALVRTSITFLTEEEESGVNSESTPCGQILTSSWKPLVFILPHCVIKGPFKKEEQLETYRRRFMCFQLLGSKVIEPTICHDSKFRLYLRFPQLATVPSEEWLYEKRMDTVLQRELHLPLRSSMGCIRLEEVSVETLYEYLFGEMFLYGSFLDAALIGCGDMGPWNCIVHLPPNKPNAWIIDYDNSTNRESMESAAAVFSKIHVQKPSGNEPKGTRVSVIATMNRLYLTKADEIAKRIAMYHAKRAELEQILGYDIGVFLQMIENLHQTLTSS